MYNEINNISKIDMIYNFFKNHIFLDIFVVLYTC